MEEKNVYTFLVGEFSPLSKKKKKLSDLKDLLKDVKHLKDPKDLKFSPLRV